MNNVSTENKLIIFFRRTSWFPQEIVTVMITQKYKATHSKTNNTDDIPKHFLLYPQDHNLLQSLTAHDILLRFKHASHHHEIDL